VKETNAHNPDAIRCRDCAAEHHVGDIAQEDKGEIARSDIPAADRLCEGKWESETNLAPAMTFRPHTGRRQARNDENAGFKPRLTARPSVPFDAVQVLLAAEEQLLADRNGRGVDLVVEFVHRDHVERVTRLQHEGRSIPVGEVDAARGGHG
jgi:hypothetical protein